MRVFRTKSNTTFNGFHERIFSPHSRKERNPKSKANASNPAFFKWFNGRRRRRDYDKASVPKRPKGYLGYNRQALSVELP